MHNFDAIRLAFDASEAFGPIGVNSGISTFAS
jgi:hypothetical protein